MNKNRPRAVDYVLCQISTASYRFQLKPHPTKEWRACPPIRLDRHAHPISIRRGAGQAKIGNMRVTKRLQAKMRCLKSFRESIAATHRKSQTQKIQICVAVTNHCTALGTAQIVNVGRQSASCRTELPQAYGKKREFYQVAIDLTSHRSFLQGRSNQPRS